MCCVVYGMCDVFCVHGCVCDEFELKCVRNAYVCGVCDVWCVVCVWVCVVSELKCVRDEHACDVWCV